MGGREKRLMRRLESRAVQRQEGSEIVQLVFCLPLVLGLLAGCAQVAFQQMSAAALGSEIDAAAWAVEPSVLSSYEGDETKERAYVKSVLTSKILTLTALDSLVVSDVEVAYSPESVTETDLNENDERNVISDPMGDYVLSEFDSSKTIATVSFTVRYTVPEFFPSPVGNPVMTRSVSREHIVDERTEVK